MKKKVIATFVAAVACVAMAFSAFAADSTQGTLVPADDKVTLGPVDDAAVDADVKDVVEKAEEGQSVSDVFAGKTKIPGGDLANLKFLSEMVGFTNTTPDEEVTFTVNNLTKDMIPYFLVYADGEWKLIEAKVNGTQLSAKLPAGGLISVVYKTADGRIVDQNGNVVSPQTGEAVTLPLAVLAAALVSVGLIAAKKSKASEC